MPVNFKLGRAPSLWTPQHHQLCARMHSAFRAMGKPPITPYDYVSAVTELVGNNWGMMLNDTWGDCTAADTGHTDMVVKANTGTWTGVPTDYEVLSFYEHFGFDPDKTVAPGENPTDQGALESDVCTFLVNTGFLGNKAYATAPIVTGGPLDDEALDRIRWCIHVFGSCRIGVNLPNSAEAQFEAGTPWALGGDETVDGGHDVPLYDYSSEDFFCVTWGGQPKDDRGRGLQRITGEWMKKYCEEAHVVLYPNLLMSSGQTPAGFDMAQLSADLQALAA